MKTNQVMTVAFEHGYLSIEHKTAMGNLADVFSIGNKHRILNNKSPANLTLFCNSKSTQEFIDSVAKRLNVDKSTLLYTKGRGKTSRVIANIFIIIYAAEYLSPDFHVEVIDTFINSKLLIWRDESGDSFKELNSVIKDCAEGILGKPAHNGHFITLAKIINSRIGSEIDWNLANAEQLKERDRIETGITSVIKLGLIRDWEHLKQIAIEV
jgi:hypothetical protein